MKTLLVGRAALAAAGIAGLSAVTVPASATPVGPSFQVTNIHYTMSSSRQTTYGLSAVSFQLEATSPQDVSAWFNTATPTPDQVYPCSQASGTWTCTAPSSAAEEDVKAATRLYVKVDGDTKVLGETITRHHHHTGGSSSGSGGSGGTTVKGEHISRGGLPFTGAYLFAELMAGAALIVAGATFLRIGRRRRRLRAA